jgi:hypothetical protein
LRLLPTARISKEYFAFPFVPFESRAESIPGCKETGSFVNGRPLADISDRTNAPYRLR